MHSHSELGAKRVKMIYLLLCSQSVLLLSTLLAVFPPVAVVGLEKTFYQVSEDVGVVEVCAIVYSPTIVCPIEFPFNVALNTTDGSAGKRR